MRTIDFTPVFRSTVGFDRMARLMDDMMRAGDAANVPAYPPYNIEKLGEDDYRITMAVAGFGEGDLDITVDRHLLQPDVTGNILLRKTTMPQDIVAELAHHRVLAALNLADSHDSRARAVADRVLTDALTQKSR